MAGGTIRVQPGAGAIGHWLREVVRIHQSKRAVGFVFELEHSGGSESFRRCSVRVGSIRRTKLKPVQRERLSSPGVVTAETFRAAHEPPRRFANAAGHQRIPDGESVIRSSVANEVRIRAVRPPPIAVGIPRLSVPVQQLRLDAARGRRISIFEFERQRSRQDRVRREKPRSASDVANAARRHDRLRAGNGQQPFRSGVIVPHRRGDRVSHGARRGLQRRD